MSNLYDFSSSMPEGFQWLNPPRQYRVDHGLHLTTDPQTDFWQRTHYGFRRDNGHALLAPQSGDFTLETRVACRPQNLYDQAGLLVRGDGDHWIKLTVEYIGPDSSFLGSVVTNSGYSDWATQAIDPQTRDMWYRISRSGMDYLLESSPDGRSWQQQRITHLHGGFQTVQAGLFACSPSDGRFGCTFAYLLLGESHWSHA